MIKQMKLPTNFLNHFFLDIIKISLNPGGSCTDSPDRTKSNKATIRLINDSDKCFQYSATVALNHEEGGKKS